MAKQLEIPMVKKPRTKKYPAKLSRQRTETVKIRCTQEFKRLLAKQSALAKAGGSMFWSESDILHMALSKYIEQSREFFQYTPTEKVDIRDHHLGINL